MATSETSPHRAGESWPRNAWYQAAWTHEVGGEPLARTLLGDEVVLFRGADGRAAALEDRCAHRATPLRLGEVTERGLQCGYHGVTFDGSGTGVHIPGQDVVPASMCVRSYPDRREAGDRVDLDGSAGVGRCRARRWTTRGTTITRIGPTIHDMYQVACSYRLLIDNLMDLTHIPFVHRKTIGGGNAQGQVNATMDVTPTDNGVHYIRWMENIQPPPTYVKGAGFAEGIMVDRWQEFEFIAPSTVVQWTGALPVGMGARENRDQPGGFSLRLYHGVTPRDETSCYYFWTPLNGYNPGDEQATKDLHHEIAITFDEDVIFLESQQQTVSARPEAPIVHTRHDKAVVQSNRALQAMIDRER